MSVSIEYEGPIICIMLHLQPEDLFRACCLNKTWNKHSNTYYFMSNYVKKWLESGRYIVDVEFWTRKENGKALNKWLLLLCQMNMYELPATQFGTGRYWFVDKLYSLIGATCFSPDLIKYITERTNLKDTSLVNDAVMNHNISFLKNLVDLDCSTLDDIIDLACQMNRPKIVDSFLRSKPNYPYDLSTALIEACSNEYVELVSVMINDSRCDPTSRSCACLRNALLFGNEELVRMLLRCPRLFNALDLSLTQSAIEFLQDEAPKLKKQKIIGPCLRLNYEEREYKYSIKE